MQYNILQMTQMLETLLGSRLRAKVLGRLFAHAVERHFVRQLAAMLGEDSTNVGRELIRLEKAGILVSTAEGKRKYYQANRQSPLFDGLASLARFAAPQEASTPRFAIPREKLAEFCRKHHINRLSLFGSVLRDDFGPDSDIDVLVEFEQGHVPGFSIIAMEEELSQLAGRRVDLRTAGELSRYFRDQVVREAQVEYAESRP